MAFWRLLGALPQARSRDETREQSLDGWNPWRFAWSPRDGLPIVVPDPREPSRLQHVRVSEAGPPGAAVTFAALLLDGAWWFYVPAAETEPDAFAAREPRYEGFWRRRFDEESELPWPMPTGSWNGRERFLESLRSREAEAVRIAYRGHSPCRLCRCPNGRESFQLAEWEWPAGFRHYVEAHWVRPSAEFEAFVTAAGE